MPESRNRRKHTHKHHPSVPPHNTVRHKNKRSAALVFSIIAAVLGLAVAFFTQGEDVVWIISGIVGGGLIGYIVGRNMDKSIEKSGS